MKTDRLVAILVVILMFEVFFLVGFFYIQPQTQYVDRVVDRVVYSDSSSFTNGHNISIYGIGVYEDNTSGELVELRFSLVPGTGRTFFDSTFHAYGVDLQDSFVIIKRYAERYTGKDVDNLDLYVRVFSVAHSVRGTSGSAAMGVAMIALLENKSLQSDLVLTGSLLADGRIGPIDSLNSKIEIAHNYGIKSVLVPNTQCSNVKPINGIQIICVRNIDEAYKQMIV
jgi:predicted S18 family serine protease